MFKSIKHKWNNFWYNFSWGNYGNILNHPVTNISLFIPIFGYLILFNDNIIGSIEFKELLGETDQKLYFLVSPQIRIKLIYFGLIFIALSRLIYLIRRPYAVKLGHDQFTYTDVALKYFTYSDYLRIHNNIREYGHNSLFGKYYDDDWDAFAEDAIWKESGRLDQSNRAAKLKSRTRVSFHEAKQRHEDLLRSMITDSYIGKATQRQMSLLSALALFGLGTVCLLIPSFDLFFRVIQFLVLGY